jgi:putative tryptophan/tyrosine transport system substrate-binding protein
VKRRDFITLLSGAAAWPLTARAQQRVPVIGFLGGPTAKGRDALIAAFRKGLTEVGYSEGRNIVVEFRWAEGRFDQLPAMANELVQQNVAVIVAFTTPAGLAAKAATSTIPIVLLAGDPVGTGLVASLSRPGGNITGLSYMIPETHGKCVEVLQDMLPSVQRVAVLGNASDSSNKQIIEQIQLAGRTTAIKIAPITMVSGADQFDAAFAKIAQEGSDAVVVHASLPPKAIADLALKYRLPAATSIRQFVEAGGLVSYGALESDLWRRSANFIHKILQGSKPADLPVEQAVKFELVVNLTTAKALGLAIPQTFLSRADEMID